MEQKARKLIVAALARHGVIISEGVATSLFHALIANDVPTSAKEMRKAGQKFRREARAAGAEYRDKFLEKLGVFNECLKPRAKWMPRSVWRWLALRFVDLEALEKRINSDLR